MRSISGRWIPLACTVVLVGGALWSGGCSSKKTPMAPQPGPGTVAGLVIDANTSQPIADAFVYSGSAVDTTGSDGLFRLSLSPGTATITVLKDGFTSNQLVVSVTSGSTRQATVGLLAIGATTLLPVSTGGAVVDSRTNARISLPANFVTASGDVSVSITGLDPTTGDIRALPGGLDAVDLSGRAVYLNPVSFAEYTVRDAAGNILPFNPASSVGADIELPIPVSLRGQPGFGIGDPIECYLYDPADGKWKTPVPGTIGASSVDGTPAIKATIFHLSWYGGAPASNDRACIEGYVKNQNGTAAAGVGVEAFTGSAATTDAAGHYQVDASPNSIIRVVATRVGGGGVQSGEVEVRTGGARDTCARAADIVLATATGTFHVTAVVADGALTGDWYLPCAGVGIEIFLETPGGGTIVTDAKVEINGGAGWKVVPFDTTNVFANFLCSGTPGFTVTAGATYDLRIDYDRDGTIDATGSVRMAGIPAITYPRDQTTVAPTFTATWNDPANYPGYAPTYAVDLSDTSFFASRLLVTTARSKVIGDGSVDSTLGFPQLNDPLPAGEYGMVVLATNGAAWFLDPFGTYATPNMTGTNTEGYFAAAGVSPAVIFTSTGAPGSPGLARRPLPMRGHRFMFDRKGRPGPAAFAPPRGQRVAMR